MYSILSLVILHSAFAIAKGGQAQWPNVTFKTNPYIMPQLQVKQTGDTADGFLFYAPIEGHVDVAPVIVTDQGDPIWMGNGSRNLKVDDFQAQTLHGKPVLSYWEGSHEDSDFGHGYGWVVILDDTYKLAYNICITNDQLGIVTPTPAQFPGTQQGACYLDSHEHYITPQNTLISSVWNVTQTDLTQFGGPKFGWIYDYIFLEIDIPTSKVIYQWHALDHVPLNESKRLNTSATNQLDFHGKQYGLMKAKAWEWFHMNSISPMPEGYLVSSRMTTSLYYVNKTSGNLIWTLEGSSGGDFTLDNGIFFSFQHMSRLEYASSDNSVFQISLFNNDNVGFQKNVGTNSSNGLLLNLDTNAMHVSLLEKFQDTSTTIFANAGGSYHNVSNGHILLGYGKVPIMNEFDGNGDLVWTGQIGPIHGGDATYRAFKSTWTATPYYPPSLVSSDDKTVFFSWNGATEYDNWNVYGCTGAGTGCSMQKNIPRQSFETNYTLTGQPAYAMVEALQGSKSMSNSTAVKVGQASSTSGAPAASSSGAAPRRDVSYGLALAAFGALALLR